MNPCTNMQNHNIFGYQQRHIKVKRALQPTKIFKKGPQETVTLRLYIYQNLAMEGPSCSKVFTQIQYYPPGPHTGVTLIFFKSFKFQKVIWVPFVKNKIGVTAKNQNLERAKFCHFFKWVYRHLKHIVHPHEGYPHNHKGEGDVLVPINLGLTK